MDPRVITPSHLFQYATQPLWIWYDLFGDASHKEPISDFAMKLLEDGVAHEELIVQNLSINTVFDAAPDTAAQATLALMKSGEPLIYQGAIQAEIDGIIYRGRPDLLESVILYFNLLRYFVPCKRADIDALHPSPTESTFV